MKTELVPIRRIRNPSDFHADGAFTLPGDFVWEFDFGHFEHGARASDPILKLFIRLPGEGAYWAPIWVRRGLPSRTQPIWGWDGDLDLPRITPAKVPQGAWYWHPVAGILKFVRLPGRKRPDAD